jgi:hypothetical protein
MVSKIVSIAHPLISHIIISIMRIVTIKKILFAAIQTKSLNHSYL